jgi:ketosteroid isomerase-like protein
MRAIFGFFALLLLSAAPVAAQEVAPADGQAIRQVIQSQLDAFRRDDAGGAYAFASPNIQKMFQTPEIFMDMVRGGYQPVYRPREVEFRELGDVNGRLIQDVFLIGPDGQPVIARYEMQKQPDGSWRINGCYLTKAQDQSV